MKEFDDPNLLIIPFQLVKDKNLEQVDRLLYGVIYWFEHMKDGRCFAGNDRIAKILGTTPRVIQNSLTNLEKNGYILRMYKDSAKRNRIEIRGLIAMRHLSPSGDTPAASDPQVTGELPTGDRASDPQVTRIRKGNKKRELEHIAPQGGAEVNRLIELFKEVNPSYERLFAIKTQREAIERMRKKFGSEKLEGTIAFAVSVSGKSYAPTITTPLQLEMKLGQLLDYYKREGSKRPMVMKV